MQIDVLKQEVTGRMCNKCNKWIEKGMTTVRMGINRNTVSYHEDCALDLFFNLFNFIQRHRPLKKQELL